MSRVLLYLCCILSAQTNIANALKRIERVSLPLKVDCVVLKWNLIKTANCNLAFDKLGHSIFNGNISFWHDTNNARVKVFLQVQRNHTFETYFETEFSCLSRTTTNFVLKFFINEIMHDSNLPVECPLKKDFLYTLKNYNNSHLVLPTYSPEIDWIVYGELYLEDVKAATINVTGRVIKATHLKKYDK